MVQNIRWHNDAAGNRTEPDPRTFPAPDCWASFVHTFKIHKSLAAAKSAVTNGAMNHNDKAARDAWVYELVGGGLPGEKVWVKRFEVKKGDAKATHPLWETPAQMRSRLKREAAFEADRQARVVATCAGCGKETETLAGWRIQSMPKNGAPIPMICPDCPDDPNEEPNVA